MDANMSPTQTTFLFNDRQQFEAKRERERLRDSLPSNLNASPTVDPWYPRPIDFSMVNFHPNRKKMIRAPSFEDISPRIKRSRHAEHSNSNVMKPFEVQYRTQHSKTDENEFIRDPRINYDRVKRMLNTEPYKNPAPHDFRQYPDVRDLDKPDFETKFDHDPGNIRFLTAHLNTLWLQERDNERIPEVKNPYSEMYRVLKAKPTWESRLVLPKVVYPNKYAAYSRYRNPTRTVESAYWERLEDNFNERRKKHLQMI
ncbi:hypothetical protein I4U23_020813 [Adineta vaga]|nr:hypothetical protein I4U23_020813 [Adineta vaga]